VREPDYTGLVRLRAIILRLFLTNEHMPSIRTVLSKERVCMKNLSLEPLMGATFVHDFCQGSLVLSRRIARLRTSHSMVVKEPVLPGCANLSC
jgi:hypothetical protein